MLEDSYYMILKLPQVEARRRNQGLRRRHEARSWSDVDVWHSLFHSPNPRRRGGGEGEGGEERGGG